MSATISTASWTALWQASQAGPLPIQPVRISRGLPKFWPAAEHFPAVDDLMPDPWMLGVAKVDFERFGRCYRRKLHVLGLPAVQARLDALTERYGSIALACFEPDPATCHRGPLGFAGWYERNAGVAIPELASLASALGEQLALVHELDPANTPPPTSGQLDHLRKEVQ